MDGFIFVGTNFRGSNKNDPFMGFKLRGLGIFFHNSYRKLPFRLYWNSWIGLSTKTTKIGTPQNLSHPQYLMVKLDWSHKSLIGTILNKKPNIFYFSPRTLHLHRGVCTPRPWWQCTDHLATATYPQHGLVYRILVQHVRPWHGHAQRVLPGERTIQHRSVDKTGLVQQVVKDFICPLIKLSGAYCICPVCLCFSNGYL